MIGLQRLRVTRPLGEADHLVPCEQVGMCTHMGSVSKLGWVRCPSREEVGERFRIQLLRYLLASPPARRIYYSPDIFRGHSQRRELGQPVVLHARSPYGDPIGYLRSFGRGDSLV